MAAGVLTNLTLTPGALSCAATVDTDVATGTVYLVALAAGAVAPSHAQIVAGTDADDVAALVALSEAAASTTTFSPAITGLERETEYDVYVTQVNGAAEASTPITDSFTTTAAAILASIEQARHGSTTMLVDVDTDLAEGVLYVVLTTNTTAPSDAQIIAGTDHADAAASWATFIEPVEGVNQVVAAGLTPSTAYFAYAVQVTDGDNSNVADSTTSTTTAATGGPTFIRPLISGVYQ